MVEGMLFDTIVTCMTHLNTEVEEHGKYNM